VKGAPRETTPFDGVPGAHIEKSLPMALHGQNQYVIFQPPVNHPGSGGGERGTYKVVFTFSRPGFALRPEGKHTFEQELEGDSHLYIRIKSDTTEIRITLGSPEGTFEFQGIPNSQGRLGKMIVECTTAQDYFDAERKAWSALSPALSWISLYLDIPLQAYQIDVIDRHTGGQMAKLLVAYRTIGMAIAPVFSGTPEFQFYASLYREALGTNSPLYQFLCLYKIIDGVYARRQRVSREGKPGTDPQHPASEIFPSADSQFKMWLDSIFPLPARLAWNSMHFESVFRLEARGKDFLSVCNAFLLPIRNRIAHALIGIGELGYSIDNAADLQTVFHWLPLTKCMVRRILKNEFPAEFMPGWREDGSFDPAEEERSTALWRTMFGTK
jgi:hypothetical protein